MKVVIENMEDYNNAVNLIELCQITLEEFEATPEYKASISANKEAL